MFGQNFEKIPPFPFVMSIPKERQMWPSAVSWLSRAHLALSLICLILQLASSCISGVPIINLTVPFVFVTAGFTTVILHSSTPTTQAALSASVLHGLSSLAAIAALVAPLLGVRNGVNVNRGGEIFGTEILYVLLAFIVLSTGILSTLICVLDWKYSKQVIDECGRCRKITEARNVFNNTKPIQPPPVVHQYETLKLPNDNFSEC